MTLLIEAICWVAMVLVAGVVGVLILAAVT